MESSKNSFQKLALLTSAKILGIFFSILIPMYLGRKLSIETYGTYKQIMLFFWFSQVGLNFGLDESVYYYIRQDPKRFPLYSINAFAFNLVASLFLFFLLVLFKHQIGMLLKNPELVQYLSSLGLLIVFTVCTSQYGGILIGLNRFKERLVLEVALEFCKSVAIISAFYFFNSIHIVLLFLNLIMGSIFLLTISIIHKNKVLEKLKYRDALPYFLDQAKFGIPLGLSRISQNILNMENFLISSMLGMTKFTYYSVGSFENPIINASRSSLTELANIEMADGKGNSEKIFAAWTKMIRRLFLILVPFIFYMIFFSKELIVFAFSAKYLPSVPVFMLFNVYVFVASLNPEPIFRAVLDTKSAFKIKTIGSIIGVIFIIAGAYWEGMMGALVGKIMALIGMNICGLVVGGKKIGKPLTQLLLPELLSKMSVLSVCLCIIFRMLFLHSRLNEFGVLAISFSLYAFIFLMSAIRFRIIEEAELINLKKMIKGKWPLRLLPTSWLLGES